MELKQTHLTAIEIPERFGPYKTVRVLGRGAFGAVVKAIDQRCDAYVAAKIVDRNQLIELDVFKHFEHETRILSSINHPNIVRIREIIYLEKYIIIIMDMCKCGDLFDHLSRNYKVSVADAYHILIQLVSALAYLHKRGIAHRDIKPENVVFDMNLSAKLIDFGVCCQTHSLASSFVGTDFFIAPEIISQPKYDPKKADIYSLGVTAFLMVTGFIPFRTTREYNAFVKTGKLPGIEEIESEPLKNIILNMMSFNPERRPSASELLDTLQEQLLIYQKEKGNQQPQQQKPRNIPLGNHFSMLTVSKREKELIGLSRGRKSGLNGSISWVRKRSAQSIPLLPNRIGPSFLINSNPTKTFN